MIILPLTIKKKALKAFSNLRICHDFSDVFCLPLPHFPKNPGENRTFNKNTKGFNTSDTVPIEEVSWLSFLFFVLV